MARLLRMAITADPELPIPPKFYGGIERVVDMLVHGLVERGHDVTLFAHPDSEVPCRLEPYPGRRSQSKPDLLRNMWHVSSKIRRQNYDLVHSFGRLAYLLPILPLQIPKLMSYQRFISPRSVVWGQRLSGGTLHFSGCSQHIIAPFADNGNWHVVHNAATLDAYQFQAQVDDDAPLVFLGRIEEIKGPHLAIEVALRTGRPLVIAGNVPQDPVHEAYFRERISPYVDGQLVRYVGPVTDRQKNELLGQAAALLMPIQWEEPFGIVMAEALACGTPVIGFNQGSVPEVVQHGLNGFVCDSVEEMAAATCRISEIDRRICRRIMEDKFSDHAIVKAYLDLYYRLVKANTLDDVRKD